MCLVLIAWRMHPRYPLIVAANRDEFYERPTLPAHRWPGASGLVAGKDLDAGGTWMGVNAAGRFAAVTNFRELEKGPSNARSRGELVTGYLAGDVSATAYADELANRASLYRGYNLLLHDGGELYCTSNRATTLVRLPTGVHGVSNGPLDSAWPKVERGRQLLAEAIKRHGPDPDRLFELLRDRTSPADAALPDTGVGPEAERLLGTIAIDGTLAGRGYGTRSATLLFLDDRGHGKFIERSRSVDGSWRQIALPIGTI
ncbi:MAG: NRDE family protein [Gammaproteobacteria bacterium]|nr:NRDE family protein [Gammaproteobacteria bacterium]